MPLKLFIVAGEASSDLHAAHFLREFKRLHPDVQAFGVGGKELQAQGMEISVPSSQISAFGANDWMNRAGEIIKGYKTACTVILERRPDVALLLDLPDFNLRIAKKLKVLAVPTAYYFSPQVWAWRKYRVSSIKRLIDKMLVVYPFEKKFYEENGVSVEFVGHPVLEDLEPRTAYRRNSQIQNCPRIAILPGSRKSELDQHFPVLLDVMKKLKGGFPLCEIRIPVASTLNAGEMRERVGDLADIVEGQAHETMKWSDIALVASGTATLECAVIGTPLALFYKVSRLSAFLYKILVSYKGPIGMPNILLGHLVAKEFFQGGFNADALFNEVVRLLENESERLMLGETLLKCREHLGGVGASQRAALHIHRLVLSAQQASKIHPPSTTFPMNSPSNLLSHAPNPS